MLIEVLSVIIYFLPVAFSISFHGKTIHPANIFSMYWLFFGGMANFVFLGKITFLSNVVVCSFVLAYVLGSVFSLRKPEKISKCNEVKINNNNSKLVFFISLANFIVCATYIYIFTGVSLTSYFTNLTILSRELSLSRYDSGVSVPSVLFLNMAIAYSLVTYFPFCIRAKQMLSLIVINLSVVFLISALLTTKLNVIIFVFVLLSAYVVYRDIHGYKILSRKVMTLGFFLLGSIYLLFVGFSLLRYGWEEHVLTLSDINIKILNYMFGDMVAFSHYIESENIKPGFSGLFYTFGIDFFDTFSRQSGVFNIYVDTFVGVKSNVYTIFRFVIEDFGFISWFFFILMGFMSSKVYNICRGGNLRLFPILVSIYLIIGMSLVSSILHYTMIKVFVFLSFLFGVFLLSDKRVNYGRKA